MVKKEKSKLKVNMGSKGKVSSKEEDQVDSSLDD